MWGFKNCFLAFLNIFPNLVPCFRVNLRFLTFPGVFT